MTFKDVEDRFVARFHARTKPGSLFNLDWIEAEQLAELLLERDQSSKGEVVQLVFDHAGLVWTDQQTNPDVVLASSRLALEALVPASAELDPQVRGAGFAVAFLYEGTSASILEVRSNCSPAEMAGAVALALTWVW